MLDSSEPPTRPETATPRAPLWHGLVFVGVAAVVTALFHAVPFEDADNAFHIAPFFLSGLTMFFLLAFQGKGAG